MYKKIFVKQICLLVLVVLFIFFTLQKSFSQEISEPSSPSQEIPGESQTMSPEISSPQAETPQLDENQNQQTSETPQAENPQAGDNQSETPPEELPPPEIRVEYNETHLFKGGVSATSVLSAQNKIFFAGNDGFVSSFEYPSFVADTWQVSALAIKEIAAHPKEPFIAIYETNEFNLHQVSVWNWNKKEPLYTINFAERVVSLSWSARGTYLFVGNTSTSGINVFDIDGNELSVFATQPGIVLLATTAESERSVVTYSETGNLIYTNLQKKSLPVQFTTESNLSTPTVLKNFTLFAGYKDGLVYLIDAVSGKITQTYTANKPIFATRISDNIPLWIEPSTNNTYCIRQGSTKTPDFVFTEEISVAAHLGSFVFVGTKEGSIYTLSQETNLKVTVQKIKSPNFTPILNVQGFGKKIYALTESAVYCANESEDSFKLLTNFFAASFKPDRMTVSESGIFLWKYDVKAPVYFYSFAQDTLKPFVKPNEAVLDLTSYGQTCLITLKFSGPQLFDINANLKLNLKITGVQSAIQINQNNILLSKNAVGGVQPIYLINIVTDETLPFPINGDFSYGLTRNDLYKNELFCCVIAQEDYTIKTIIYKIVLNTERPLESSYKKVLSYNGETLNRFIKAQGAFMVTNLGELLVAVDGRSSQVLSLARSYALSIGGTFTDKFFFALNADGTLSVYDADLNFVKILKLVI